MKKQYIIISALILLFSINLSAQVDRSKAPEPGPTPTIKMGEYEEFTLSNGLKVLLVEDHKLPIINMSINFIHEPLVEGDKAGFLTFFGEMWKKGTTSKDVDAINEELDFIGAYLSTSSRRIGFHSLSKYTEQMVELMADVLLNPVFPESEEAKLKTQYESVLSIGKTDPSSIMANVSDKTIYGDNHPYGDIESAEKLKNFCVKDCQGYYSVYIRPNNAIMVIVGDITLKEAKKLLNNSLEQWKAGDVPTYAYDFPASPKGVNVIFSNKDAAPQSSIEIAYPVNFKPGDKDFFAARIANYILGGGGFQAKLLKNLREDKGYTYGAYSRLNTNRLVAEFYAGSEVNANATDSSLVEMAKEMQSMLAGEFTDEDIKRTKATLAGSFSRSMEDASTIADLAYNIERNNLPKDYYQTYLQQLDAVTKEEVLAAAKKFFDPKNAYYFVVGDRGLIPVLEKLDSDGVVVELDYLGEPVVKQEIAGDVTVEGVLAKFLEFSGGQELIRGLKDMSSTQVMNVQGMTMETVSKMILGENNAFSIAQKMGGNTMMEIKFVDGIAEMKSPQGSQKLPKEQSATFKTQGYPFVEAYVEELGIKTTLEGIEDLNGKKVYKVKIDIPGATSYNYYDVETGEKAKVVSSAQGQTQEQTLSDYKTFENGIKYPMTIEMNMMGMNVKVETKEVKFDSGLTVENL